MTEENGGTGVAGRGERGESGWIATTRGEECERGRERGWCAMGGTLE